jgi:hypothetical protein
LYNNENDVQGFNPEIAAARNDFRDQPIRSTKRPRPVMAISPQVQAKTDRNQLFDDMKRARPNRSPLYNKRRWRRASRLYLAHHIWCAICQREAREGKIAELAVEPASEVDHIVPFASDPDPEKRFWDQNNWQATCHRHHVDKTNAEQGCKVKPRISVFGYPI